MAVIEFFSVFVCLFCMIFCVLFLTKIKKKAQHIEDELKTEIDGIIRKLNKTTKDDIDIIEYAINELRTLKNETDRYLNVAKKELEKQYNSKQYESMISEASRIAKPAGWKNSSSRAVSEYARVSDGAKSAGTYRQPEEMQDRQGELFAAGTEPSDGLSFKKSSAESGGGVPSGVEKLAETVTFASEPLDPRKVIRKKIIELNNIGCSVDEIATELNLSTIEVQFILDMDFLD